MSMTSPIRTSPPMWADAPFDRTVEKDARIDESGRIVRDRRVYLWVGKRAWFPIEEIFRHFGPVRTIVFATVRMR